MLRSVLKGEYHALVTRLNSTVEISLNDLDLHSRSIDYKKAGAHAVNISWKKKDNTMMCMLWKENLKHRICDRLFNMHKIALKNQINAFQTEELLQPQPMHSGLVFLCRPRAMTTTGQ